MLLIKWQTDRCVRHTGPEWASCVAVHRILSQDESASLSSLFLTESYALRAEQVAALYRNASPAPMAASSPPRFCRACSIPTARSRSGRWSPSMCLVFSSSIARLFLVRAYGRMERPPAEWRIWAAAAVASTLAGGICWGLSTVLLMDPVRVELQFIVILVCAGMAGGAVTAFATYLPAYYVNLLPIMGPTVIWSAFQNDRLHWTYAVLALLWIVVMALLARTFAAHSSSRCACSSKISHWLMTCGYRRSSPRRRIGRSRAFSPRPAMIFASRSMRSNCSSVLWAESP